MAGHLCNDVDQKTRRIQTDHSKYDKNFPHFRKPDEIGSFSLDDQHHFFNDRSQLREYYPPKDVRKCQFDLRHGYHKMIKKDESVRELIDNMLNWIMENKERFIIKDVKMDTKSSINMFKRYIYYYIFVSMTTSITKFHLTHVYYGIAFSSFDIVLGYFFLK